MGEVTLPLATLIRWLLILLLPLLAACTPAQNAQGININALSAAWTQTNAAALSRPPQILKNIVVVLPQTGALQAFDLQTGEERWQLETPAHLWRESLTTTLDSVLLAGAQGRLLALGTRRGVTEWEIALEGEVQRAPLVDRYVIFAAANAAPPNVGGVLYALNAANGETLWRFDLPGAAIDTPVRASDLVLFSAAQGNSHWLYALGAADGVLRWRVALKQPPTTLVATRAAVLTLTTEALRAFDLAAGETLWENTPPEGTKGVIGAGEIVITWGEGEINAWVADDGQQQWNFPLSNLHAPPLLRRDQLFALTADGELLAIDVQTGQAVGRFATGIIAPDTLSIQGAWVLLSDVEGSVYALQAEKP